jgi:hypothetical protein
MGSIGPSARKIARRANNASLAWCMHEASTLSD